MSYYSDGTSDIRGKDGELSEWWQRTTWAIASRYMRQHGGRSSPKKEREREKKGFSLGELERWAPKLEKISPKEGKIGMRWAGNWNGSPVLGQTAQPEGTV